MKSKYLYYILLFALANDEEKTEFARSKACDVLLKKGIIHDKYGVLTVTPKAEKKLSKMFGIKFEKEEIKENEGTENL